MVFPGVKDLRKESDLSDFLNKHRPHVSADPYISKSTVTIKNTTSKHVMVQSEEETLPAC